MKHPLEMPDETLYYLGFERKVNPYSEEFAWTHKRSCGQFYFHILTPEKVAEALIEIGHAEFRRKCIAEIESIDMNNSHP